MSDPSQFEKTLHKQRLRQALQRFGFTALAALSTTQAKAAAATGALASTTATITNTDPLPWIVSALGALVVIVKFPAVSRLHGMTNAVISVCIGGLGAQSLTQYLQAQTSVAFSELFVAFVLSALWPVGVAAVHQTWPALRARFEKLLGGN
jgi:hypothetical protein